MKLFLVLILSIIFSISSKGSDTTKVSSSLFLGVGQDSYYGFYTYAFGYYGLKNKKKTSLVIYTISRGIQAGTGLRFAIKSNLFLIPIIGVINGKTLSGGNKQVLGEGITPGILSSFYGQNLYYDQGLIYYKDVRKSGPITSDYLWYWVTLGYNINKRFNAGIHYEQLYLSRISEGKTSNLYQFIAPYIQANYSKGSYLRFTGGYDFVNGEFIRMSMVFSFI